MAKRESKPLIRPNSMCFWEPSRCDEEIPTVSALLMQTDLIRTKWCENRANSMHFTHPILNRLERGWNVRILPNTYRWTQLGLSSEYQSNFISMPKRRSKPLILPNSMCFWEPSRCGRKIPIFSALILQTKFICTKWCLNRAISMHLTYPILNRLERDLNVRILPNTYRWNQTRFIERILVEIHFYG
jgi:hypothetical protein